MNICVSSFLAEENGLEARLLTMHAHLLQHMTITYVGEQLPNIIPSSSDSSFVEPTKIAHPTKSESSLSSQGVNGESKGKEKRKRSKRPRDDEHLTKFGSLDDVPTPSVSAAETNGNHASPGAGTDAAARRDEYLKLEESRPQSVSPALVLQPPSAFDTVKLLSVVIVWWIDWLIDWFLMD